MRTHAVVVVPPRFDGGLGIREIEKPMLVQALVPEAAVEAFDKGILFRLAWLDEGERGAMLISPLIHSLAAKLRPVAAHNRAGIAAAPRDAIQGGDHVKRINVVVKLP